MCARWSDWLHRVSKGWVALAALAVFVAFTALVLPGQSANAAAYSEGIGSPDTSFLYTPDDLYRMAEAYGSAGRQAYIRARFTFDLVWPVVYTLFLATALSWLWGRVAGPGARWRRANLVPVVGAFFDYLENISAALVMARYPAATPVVDWLAPAFTLGKWLLIYGSFVLLLAGVIAVAWRALARRRG